MCSCVCEKERKKECENECVCYSTLIHFVPLQFTFVMRKNVKFVARFEASTPDISTTTSRQRSSEQSGTLCQGSFTTNVTKTLLNSNNYLVSTCLFVRSKVPHFHTTHMPHCEYRQL